MQRRIQVADGHGTAFQDLVHGLEVALLHGQHLVPAPALRCSSVSGQNHFAHGGDAVGLKEHVLGTAKADALRAEVDGLLWRRAGVSALVRTFSVRASSAQPMKRGEIAGDGWLPRWGSGLAVHIAGGAVHGDASRPRDRPCQPTVTVLSSSLIFSSPQPATQQRAHAAGNHRRVRGHAAAGGQDALGGVHALDVFRRGLQAHQDDLLCPCRLGFGVLGGEVRPGRRQRSGRSGQALGDGRAPPSAPSASKLGCSRESSCLGSTLQHGLFFGDHAFVHQVHGDLQRGG